MKRVLLDENKSKLINREPYLWTKDNEVDFYMGNNRTEATKICRQIITMKKSNQ